jgi:hypothetical protein
VFQHKVNGRGGQIPIQAAISELPEWLQSALYRGAAKGGLTETDPLWGCLVANGELLKSYLDAQPDGTKKSVEELTQAIRELSRSVKHRVEPESRPENIAKLWAAILIAVVAVFGIGYLACWGESRASVPWIGLFAFGQMRRLDRPADVKPAFQCDDFCPDMTVRGLSLLESVIGSESGHHVGVWKRGSRGFPLEFPTWYQ